MEEAPCLVNQRCQLKFISEIDLGETTFVIVLFILCNVDILMYSNKYKKKYKTVEVIKNHFKTSLLNQKTILM